MPHSQLIRPNQARLHYVHTLRAAYQRYIDIIDPDYAHQNDREAWQKIRRDAVISHAIGLRRKAVAGIQWNVQAASDTDVDKQAASIVEDLIKPIRRFQQARMNLAEAIFRGSSWGFIRGDRRTMKVGGDNVPRTWWVPNAIKHVDRWRFRLARINPIDDPFTDVGEIKLQWEMFSLERGFWEPLESPEWFIRHDVENTEETMGYGRGLLQDIFFFWRAKEIALSQGLAGLERWAQGLIQVGIDGARDGADDTATANEDIVDEWIDQLSKQRSEHILVGDKNDEITVHQGPGQGHQMVLDFLGYFDKALTQLILTSVLPTGGGDTVGSNARAEIESQQMEKTFTADREALAETLTDNLIGLVWDRNYPLIRDLVGSDDVQMPHFEITQSPLENPSENISIVTQALQAGVPLLKEEVYRKLGFTMPNNGDDVIEGQQPQAPGMPGGGFPFKDLGSVDGRTVLPDRWRWLQREDGLVVGYAEGAPCAKGETSAKTGCTPADGEGGKHEQPDDSLLHPLLRGFTGERTPERIKQEIDDVTINMRSQMQQKNELEKKDELTKAEENQWDKFDDNIPLLQNKLAELKAELNSKLQGEPVVDLPEDKIEEIDSRFGVSRTAARSDDSAPIVGAEEWFQELINFDEAEAIKDYTSSGFRDINKALRSGEDTSLDMSNKIDNIRSAINKAPKMDKPITVWRGVSASAIGGSRLESNKDKINQFLERASKNVGKNIRLSGFQSTTTDPNVASAFSTGSANDALAVFEISTEHGAPVGEMTDAPENEKEILLNEGWTYRIEDVIKDVPFGGGAFSNKRNVIRLTAIGPGGEAAINLSASYKADGYDMAEKFNQPLDAVEFLDDESVKASAMYGEGQP
jgi:hypothetical protein